MDMKWFQWTRLTGTTILDNGNHCSADGNHLIEVRVVVVGCLIRGRVRVFPGDRGRPQEPVFYWFPTDGVTGTGVSAGSHMT